MRVLTPGTLTDEALLDDRADNLLAAITQRDSQLGIATLDMSSGRFQLLQLDSADELHAELQRLNPVELLISEDLPTDDFLQQSSGVRYRAPWEFDLDSAQRLLNKQFGTKDLAGFGCDHLPAGLSAAGCLLQYALDTQRNNLPHIRSISAENREDRVALDASSRRNLELDINLTGGEQNTLFDVLDNSSTSMASRPRDMKMLVRSKSRPSR